ncbi:hypothetical protein A2154_00405 [Candidatus Gottesmanbacteria bacterium RBG_16_43_7]|uniref:TNase-like domain-containing protein n=1 Tax=Candidatus Gottesmanbacteria bacterium RBG_16_43_7 TaxID=1798373 RepID=A0A1F5Z8Q3_9BACT|nr:MAG: hypothetical protein A2154_00405 [Candidatus Gottesmanbacteria bacterium RBG_16_43_7]
MKRILALIGAVGFIGSVAAVFLLLLDFTIRRTVYLVPAQSITVSSFINKLKSETDSSKKYANDSETESVRVIRVIDGDTIEIEGNRLVRYIGINTPELGQGSDPECYAQSAFEANRALVAGKTVRLVKDVSETDKYFRLLRYVYINEQMVNEFLVRNGFAHAATFPPDVKYGSRFVLLERAARKNNLGLWTACDDK